MISINDNNKWIQLFSNWLTDILYFYRNENFTDNGLTNFGKSLENVLTLSSITFDFGL